MEDTLRDIKPLVEIPDSSFYIYILLIIISVIFMIILIFIISKKIISLKRINKHKEYIKKLKSIDFKDAKQGAYDTTYYGRLVANTPRKEEIFSQLLPFLEQYKYKKNVESIDKDTLNQFNLFVQVIDE